MTLGDTGSVTAQSGFDPKLSRELGRLDFRRSRGRSAGSFPEQRLEIETRNWASFKFRVNLGAFRVNRDQVMYLQTWLKIHTNISYGETASPKTT